MEEKLNIIEAMDVYLPDVDGVVNTMHNYCLNLNKKANVNVLVPKNKKGYVDSQPYKIHRCKSMYIPFFNYHYGIPALDKKFKQEAEKLPCDIIHVHSPFNMANYSIKLARKKGIPVVGTFHSNFRADFRNILRLNGIAELFTRHVGNVYNKMDEVFVGSTAIGEMLRSYGYKGKLTVMPLGTDFPKCENVEELRKEANKQYNLKDDDLVFLFVGRLMKIKRIDFILRGLKIVKESGQNFKFFVMGSGHDLKSLQKLTRKLGIEENVNFVGFMNRTQSPPLFARADLLLFPSVYDTFGLVRVEAAAYNTPGVFVKDTCAGFGVDDNKNGFLCEDNEKSFADTILNAVKDKEKLKQVGLQAGKDLYINWEECSEKLYKRLKEIVEEKKKGL